MGFTKGSLLSVLSFYCVSKKVILQTGAKKLRDQAIWVLLAARHSGQELREAEPGTLQVLLGEGKDIASWKVEFRNFLCLPLSSTAIESPLRFTPGNKLGWPFGLDIREKFSKIRGSHTSLREQIQEQIQLTATYHNQSSLSMETHLERRKELRKDRHVYRKTGVGLAVHTLMEWH